MKNTSTFSSILWIRFVFILISCLFVISRQVVGQVEDHNTGGSRSFDETVAETLNGSSLQGFRNLLQDASSHRAVAIQKLIKILNDNNSGNLQRRYAAYYLGEIKATEAVDSLAAQITLNYPGTLPGTLAEQFAGWNNFPAFQALEQIGSPSIPAVIRNLSESDDTKTRGLSLRVLVHIDGDKDISQLRLQKAIKAETDPQKQARLQSALKALPGTSL